MRRLARASCHFVRSKDCQKHVKMAGNNAETIGFHTLVFLRNTSWPPSLPKYVAESIKTAGLGVTRHLSIIVLHKLCAIGGEPGSVRRIRVNPDCDGGSVQEREKEHESWPHWHELSAEQAWTTLRYVVGVWAALGLWRMCRSPSLLAAITLC